jgi:hypothetical protein
MSNHIDSKQWFALRPDAQAFDEVRIFTQPRYKTSGLSGDEWRISATIQLLRKGKVCHEQGFRNILTACGFLYAVHQTACDDGKAYFAGDGLTCDQEGCSNPPSVAYQKKFAYENDGHKRELSRTELRCFCEEHKERGDCGLDDADDNYIQVPLP